MSNKIKQAFTLIELLVVIAIVGILSGLIIVGMGGLTSKATVAKAQAFSTSLRNALMMNMIAEWKMDEGSGQTSADTWSEFNNAILGSTAGVDANDPVWVSTDCVRGSCLQFDGGTTYITITDNPNLRLNGDFTIEFWAKRTGATTGTCCPGILKKGNSATADGYLIYYAESGDTVSFKRNNLGVSWSGTLPLGTGWKYFAITYNNALSQAIFYINGAQTRLWSGSFPNNAGVNVLNIGYGDAKSINGQLDEIRMYSATLSISQIKEQYYAGLNALVARGEITKEEYLSRIKHE